MIAQVGIPHGKARIEVAASIGVAPLVEDASPADIIAAADQAMYARKDERRGLPAAGFLGRVSCRRYRATQ